ncbi:signal-induced proliferation-associated 1-like protein 2 [Sinocyclocheilus anshuiensis]|uniref:signal-induced proliferation-associated 1-like protein 2 n=1 Tax=Sinocyclocheilus anshuiensis TaxID=1608454 RepID=UPI0007B9A403|nr:PREDICTED: signal-induced proliferation-associated 1-like protein 2 [Sinocyclocheilus anshuiensis]
MQSDDLFIRKFRRQSPRPPLVRVNFDPKQDDGSVRTRVLLEWPPRREGEGTNSESVTPSAAALNLRTVGRGHIMQRSNSDVTLGDLDSAGQVGRKLLRVGCDKSGTAESLHREYGSLSSLERQTQTVDPSLEDQGVLSPNALRFRDPFLLLGLQEAPPEVDGVYQGNCAPAADTSKPVKPPKPEGLGKKAKPSPMQAPQFSCDQVSGGAWVRNFAHYDVQSILFDLLEAATNRDSIGRKKNITSGASAASQLRPLSQSTPSSCFQGGGGCSGSGTGSEDLEQSLLDEGDGNDNDLLLSCPHFRNEMGGEESVGLGLQRAGRHRWRSLQSPNNAVSVLEEPRESHVQAQGKSNYFIEHADLGARYYHKYFYMKDHQNFFGMDERLGPVAVSFRREEKEGSSGSQYNYRIIFRTTELKTLRGSILEESVPSAARHTTPRGLSPKRLLEFILPDLNLHCLRLASTSPKVRDTLLKLDEQGLNFQHKVGIMYCRAGQSTEEDMYNNESAGPKFDEFLDLLGERVRLKDWEKYRAQLDTKTDSTGTHSLYTRYQDYEIIVTAEFRSMATRMRQEYLKDLAENYVTTTPIDSSTKFPLLSLGGKRKEKLKGAKGAELHSAGALVWAVTVVQGGENNGLSLSCLLGVSAESVVLIERSTRTVVFNCSCRDVIGWKAVTESGAQGGPSLDIFYERGEAVTVTTSESQVEDIKEVVQRLELVTRGCEAREVTPLRDGVGQPGFLMSEEGFVTELQRFGYAESGPPDENGKPRRSFSELYQKAIQDAESKSGEGRSGEAWVLDDDEEVEVDGGGGEKEEKKQIENKTTDRETPKQEIHEEQMRFPEPMETDSLLSPPSLPLLRATSLQDSMKNQSPEVTPVSLTRSYSLEGHAPYQDIIEGTFVLGGTKEKFGCDQGPEDRPSVSDVTLRSSCMESAERNSRALSLHNSITKILSETADSSEEEWQSISDLANACRNILEALSREDRTSGDGSQASPETQLGQTDTRFIDIKDSDSPGHLEEKVSQLEAMLKRLQDDLQKSLPSSLLQRATATSQSQSHRGTVEVGRDKQKKPVLSLSRVNRGDEKIAGGTMGSHAHSQH